MEYVAFGKTNFLVSRIALAVTSLKSLDDQEQSALILNAYDAGVNFFGLEDGDVLERQLPALASAFHEIRRNVFLNLRLNAVSPNDLRKSLEHILLELHTDYIDILHIEGFSWGDSLPEDLCAMLARIKTRGIIRAAGLALPAARHKQTQIAPIFESLQFPFNLCAGIEDKERVQLCEKRALGCVISEPLCAPFDEIEEAYTFLRQFEHAVPLWEVKTPEQMAALLHLAAQ
jgi:aryl-alcohol dehydrogenase-like predicted oxidoreductase